MKLVRRAAAAALSASMFFSLFSFMGEVSFAEKNTDISPVERVEKMEERTASRSYSSEYKDIKTLENFNKSGSDTWRFGLVTGNGENGLIESCGSAEDVMIFQNMKFGYPTNAIRITPDMSSARGNVMQKLIKGDASGAVNDMTNAASAWVKEKNLGTKWDLQNTYAFHPAHQLRLKMDGVSNGNETKYTRYTDYQTGEIGTEWTDAGGEWKRTTFSSREDNVNISSLISLSGAKINMTISVDDIAKMSDEHQVGTDLSQIRYRKVADGSGDYIGFAAHYPCYANSELNNAGFAGITRIIVKGESASKQYVFGTEDAENYTNPVGGANETVINAGYDKAPSIKIENADAVYLITKTDRDKNMGTLKEFISSNASDKAQRNGTAYAVVSKLIDDTAAAAKKYSTAADYSDFDYAAALEPSAAKHSEIFNRIKYSVCVNDEDKAMRSYTNEQLIDAQKSAGSRLLPAMMERLFDNGRFAAICASGIQAPRLGGMWTGAWGCDWSGDYTTDANINLQIAGANIGGLPEETTGFINVMLKNITDWQFNAKQVYGIDNALMAPPRTDGDSAALIHFSKSYPFEAWNSGAGWLIQPMYEYYKCYGDVHIALTQDIRSELEYTGNKYAGYSSGVTYNMRNTLGLSDERVNTILSQGYFELKEDILHPLLTKTANFWLNFVDARYYTKDGKAYYDENHTSLAEGESWLLAPGYSPENTPEGSGSPLSMNTSMDIACARSVMDMAAEIEDNSDIKVKYQNFAVKLPSYLYEETGELKEWALSDYNENYAHRHASQLYGLWPAFESETDTVLFNGAKKLIETKNSYSSSDDKTGHGWLHRGLVMARLKDGEGVKDTLIPLLTKNMIYPSMMMSHNNDRTRAYCTDSVITIPAIELETLVYSDENTIELLPAMLAELESGGKVGGTEGIHTRNGGTVSSLIWDNDSIKAVIKNSAGAMLKLNKKYDSIKVNGEDVSSKLEIDVSGEKYYKIDTDNEVTVEYELAKKENITETNYIFKGSISANAMRYIKGWDGNGYSTGELQIADKQSGISTYNKNDASIGKGYDINVGFVSFKIPEGLNLTNAVLKLTSKNGQYNTDTTAYAAAVDLSETVVSNQNAADSIENISWANRPVMVKTSAGIQYRTGGGNTASADINNPLSITLKDSNGELIVSSGENVTLAVYFNGASAREDFSDAVLEYEYALPKFTSGSVIWGSDVIAVGGNHQGSSGGGENNIKDFGKFKNVDDNVKLFFPSAKDGETVGKYNIINAIDNAGSSQWNGYAEIDIVNAEAGEYNVYVLGNTPSTDRMIEVINTSNASTVSMSTDTKEYSTSENLKIMKSDKLKLKNGENTIRLQAPSGKSAPNFIAMLLVKNEPEETPAASETPNNYEFIRLDRSGFIASANSERSASGNYSAGCVLDGKDTTMWHTDWDKASDFDKNADVSAEKPPITLTIDMGSIKNISRFVYLSRIYSANSTGSVNGVVTKYDFQISADNENWSDIAKGEWEYSLTDGKASEQTVTFDPTAARYVRLIVRDNMSNSNKYTASAAEIYLENVSDESQKPLSEAREKLSELISDMENSTFKEAIINKLINSPTLTVESAEKIRNILPNISDAYKKSAEWIRQGINPWYFERLNNMLEDKSFSDSAVSTYLSEISAFESKGSELSDDIIRDMGEEFVMSDEEKNMPLSERMAAALSKAKAKIDENPSENYVMLKELVSYITRGDDRRYTDVQNKYGVDALTAEYVVTNINFALKNLGDKALMNDNISYKSGTMWLDKYGSKISAGGGQIIKGHDNKYYWYGEDNKVAYSLHTGVSCYSTEDFKVWTYEGLAFNIFDDSIASNKEFADEFMTDTVNSTQGRIERPKVIYNSRTGKYIMWMHLEKDGVYTFSQAGVAVSDNPAGPFEWKWYGKPVYDPNVTYNAAIDQAFRDMNLFVDDDGAAYVIYSSEANRVPYIVKLNDEYTWIDTEGMNTVSKTDFENGTAAYNNEGVFYTGNIYDYNSDGSGYSDENGNNYTLTEDDMKTLVYLDTTKNGIKNNIQTTGRHNYYLPSFTRAQLTNGNRILIRQGNAVDRADGLNYIPLTSGKYGRWAKIGQYEEGCSNYREAPALVKKDGIYYMTASGISGWKANQGIYLKTDNLFGKWITCSNPFIGSGQIDYTNSYSYNRGYWESGYYPNASKSFLSQGTYIFEYGGNIYYMGDRWKDGDYWDTDGHLGVKKSTYVWLPITFTKNGKMEIAWTDCTEIDSRNLMVNCENIGAYYGIDKNGDEDHSTKATGFVTSIVGNGSFNRISWNVSDGDKSKTFTENLDVSITINGSSIYVGMIVDGLYSNTAEAEASVETWKGEIEK